MQQEQTTKIILAEDQVILLDGLAEILNRESNMEVIGLAQNGKQALSMIEENMPDIAVLDIEMPVMNGIELTEILKKKYPELKILILSFFKRDDYITNLVKMGIDGYILKERGKMELVSAINTIMAGKKYLGSTVTEVLMNNLHSVKPKEESKLTKREEEILVLVARGLSASQIADKLFIGEVTVNTHKRNIREKLQIKGAANYLRYAIKHGYIDIDEIKRMDDYPSESE